MMTQKIKILLVLLTLVLAACTGEAVEPITIDLSGSQWQLVDMNGTQPVPDRVPTLHFVDESNLAGWTGCNDYEGGYELVGTAFTPGIIFSNLMACVQEDVMAQQRSYLQILGDATRLTLANDTLTIQGDAGTLVFEPVPEQEVGLAGTEWQLASINGSSPIEGTDATLRFEEDGIMGGSTGCNQYGGSYRASGDNLTVTEMAWTEMACLEPEGIMEQESEFTRILSSAHGFDLTGSVLEIYADGGYLVFEPLHTDIEEEPMVDLPYVRWQLATINGENPLPDTRVTLIFENDTTLSGSGGCNGYGGTYAIDGEGFTTGDIVRTLMACAEPEGIMEQEDAVLAILQSANRFSYTDDEPELYIYGEAGELMFTPLHTPEPASLQGTEWTLESFIEGDAVSSTLAGTTLTLLLDDDGTYSGSAGCNTYGGTYTLQGEALTFGPPRMSRMMCAEDIMRQERSYLQLLESVAMFSLEGDQLILSTPSGEGLDFRQ